MLTNAVSPPELQTENPLDLLLGYNLRRASATVLADLGRTLEDLSLRPTEASVLVLIRHNPGITQSEIGRILGIQRANMAPIAAMLTKRALIERAAADGRSQGLRTTVSGARLAADVRDRMDRHEARFLSDLAPAERDALIALVRRVWAR